MDFLAKRWRYTARKLATYFRIFEADAALAAGFRAQQIHAILRLTPLTMLANAFNACVVLLMFWHSNKFYAALAWSLTLIIVVILGSRAWLKQRHRPPPAQVSKRAIKRATLHALGLSFIWGLLPILTFDSAQAHTNTLLLTTICTGMICAGGFALSTIPQAAITYVMVMTLGCELALIKDGLTHNWSLAILLGLYAFIISSAVLATARTFGARLMAEAAAEHQQQLISLLMHDFESNASDWLWELNSKGCLQEPSQKLLNLLGTNSINIIRKPFTSLFDHDRAQSESYNNPIKQLEKFLNEQEPFRDIVLPILIRGECHWWQLTAKPLFDKNQQFIGWRGVGSDVTHKRNAELEMRRLANVDSLTNLANRHYFFVQLSAAKSHSPMNTFAMFFLDLDNFKNVNDSLGHGVGDLVLQTVAQRLLHTVRNNDLLARLGGDEFAIISYGENSIASAGQLAQRILDTFTAPCIINGKSLQVGCSIGIALSPDHGQEPETLLKNADMALYAAKFAGRNTYRFYEMGMEIVAQQKLHLLNDMRSALEEHTATSKLLNKRFSTDLVWPQTPIVGQFEIFFQPQLKLSTLEIIGFEALLRWHHPELGLISPAQFIPLAEESSLIIPIGTWVLVEACKYAAKWPHNWRIAVNLSAVQFREGTVVDVVRWALQISRLAPERLELEITESLLIHDNQAAQQTLSELRNLGVRIALDDFGTGYSSLAYLRSFPLNKLKIDRSFVSALTKDASALAIVNAIIQLAEALMLETTAEGIESELEADILRTCGCSDAQGFYFGKPMNLPDVMHFARNHHQRITQVDTTH